MTGCLRARVRKQPIIALYFELKNELEFYNLDACHFRFRSYDLTRNEVPRHFNSSGKFGATFQNRCLNAVLASGGSVFFTDKILDLSI